ncbi:DedA family protein [Thermoleptolyngbya oregonensis NK1-22]|uniref:DedA family protein n=1 Tax=Thermoleptolyngbya oregonensis NK1-22 TaxID=2547457 RepID=A0AA96YA72_9CYAN|nr:MULTISPECIES: DedA family protein [Thermoleptolyngbya]MDG2617237.1 DedA family protein [Thermoleptolyngbya sichuanensis XZ-Cy5]WOB42845.1 DedA family protein [Thermoleptolyngbya oregonensis NK1-22]HIK39809.1 DedA family protein [Thermoleptolyngbya sp. M55_K2018_002]
MSLELLSLEALENLAHEYGYWVVFLGIMLENTGVPLPGETITLVGGFLAGSDELNYWLVLASATAGAVLGDNFGYWIGYFGGWPLLVRAGRVFRIEESRLLAVRTQFSENAARAVIFGRFLALLRIFAGPLAGIAQMPYPQFLLCNLIGALSWASVMVTLAFFVGKLIPLEQLVTIVGQFAVVALLLFCAAIALPIWLEHRAKQELEG